MFGVIVDLAKEKKDACQQRLSSLAHVRELLTDHVSINGG